MAEFEHNREQNERAMEIADALHEAGFAGLWIDSTAIFSGGPMSTKGQSRREVRHQYFSVVIDREEMGAEEMQKVYEIAEVHSAHVVLKMITAAGLRLSRIAIWPRNV